MATPNLRNPTSVVPGIVFSGQLPSGQSSFFTVGTGNAVQVSTFTLCNISGSAVTVEISIIPSGGALDGTHKVITGYSLAAGATIALDDLAALWLGDGDVIRSNVSAATAIDVTITGLTYS